MTDIAIYFLAAFVSSALTSILWMRHGKSWSDDDHFALVKKYAEAASALTSMKAELDKIQEQLEFSEDVRYALGMENANLAKEIEGLNRDVEKGEEARLFLMGQLNIVINDKLRLEDRLKVAERSLRIARHKEFKRWKKASKRRLSEYRNPTPATYHYAIGTARWSFRHNRKDWSAKERMREYIDKIRTMDPYPLP